MIIYMTDYSQFGPSLFKIDDSVHEKTLKPILQKMELEQPGQLKLLWYKTVDMFINNKFKYYEKTYDKSSSEQRVKKLKFL